MTPTMMENLRPREGKVSTQVQIQACYFLSTSMFKHQRKGFIWIWLGAHSC